MVTVGNQSTVEVFFEQHIFTNLRKSSGREKVHCNKVLSEVFYVRDLKIYGIFRYDFEGISNILPLENVKNKFPLHYGISEENAFIITNPDKEIYFMGVTTVLYYQDKKH